MVSSFIMFKIKKKEVIEMNEKARYTEVSEEQEKRIYEIRKLFSNVYDVIENTCQLSRETSLAITKLEEAQFWVIKGITREKWEEK